MTCEALVARLADPSKVLSIVKSIICVSSISKSVMNISLILNLTPLLVTATDWFDLSSKRGRKLVATNLCGIMHWARQW
ncbi:uncharacterized protein N7515_005839 [Penicillium bovifimosum]|uniref:Uncharacterized protein n=1 Tax=Penicillium bovifimosum TaxID=126998 RepID=A0A9W9L0I9_9EURO|nr:uncharacterized protein N7515_005839 [Penicillium bovifimosum]KAJ5129800.1 hypothetical protein N7515_005839 [Penicillium bovifimosum]